jgi:hypothetical protein
MINIDLAKTTPIELEIARRGAKLLGRGFERCGPCPVCGGRDRFSINLKKQVWNCRGCSKGGDVLDLVQHLDGVGFKDAVKTLAGTEPRTIMPTKPAPEPPDDNANIKFVLRIWNEALDPHVPIIERYFKRRRLKLTDDVAGRVVRFHDNCPWRRPDGTAERRPCMITAFRSIADDSLQAIQRTALDDDGQKTGRLSLGPMGGAAIKIDADENVEQGLMVSEGFETGLSGWRLGLRPVWALGSADAIRKLPVLGGINTLTIFRELDDKGANAKAIRECGNRWAAAGRNVVIATPHGGGDLNDALRRRP